MESIQEFVPASARAPTKGVLQQPLERRVSMRLFLRRTSALLVKRLQEFFELRAH
jgi:hypothetical protein